jgi:hypothetical protein
MSMPQDPDSRLDQPATEAATVAPVPAPDGAKHPVAAESGQPVDGKPAAGDQPHRRRRRRRRRRRPRVEGAEANGSTPLAESSAAAPTASAQPAAVEGSSTAPPEQAASTPSATTDAPRKGRRRRRGPPRQGSGAAPAGHDPMSSASGAAAPAPAATEPKEPRHERHRARRPRSSREERARGDDSGREQSRDPRLREGRDARGRDADRGRHKPGAGGPKDRRRGPDRGDFRRKPEPKLYRLESIVDRGFEEVADPATEGATRRVDWTILKRTTADQRTARALAAIYVLRRDGTDAEFAQLGAARAAVHKTISHPEKLTLSKAEHAKAKDSKR